MTGPTASRGCRRRSRRPPTSSSPRRSPTRPATPSARRMRSIAARRDGDDRSIVEVARRRARRRRHRRAGPGCAGCEDRVAALGGSFGCPARRAAGTRIDRGAAMRIVLAEDGGPAPRGPRAGSCATAGIEVVGRRRRRGARCSPPWPAPTRAGRRDRGHPDAADLHGRGAAAPPRPCSRPIRRRPSWSCPRRSTRSTPSACWATADGGVGYLLKDRVADIDELVDAVRRVGAGGTVIDPEVVASSSAGARAPRRSTSLTGREARGAGPDGRGPLEPGHRRHARSSARRPSRRMSRSILGKLGLEPEPDDHRRVLAVLTWLRGR